MTVAATALPPAALLATYAPDEPADRALPYVDCFAAVIDRRVSLPTFVQAFYTTWLFRAERFVLQSLLSCPSSDAGAAAVALGEADRFAAWTVEARTEDQLLMTDHRDRTRS